MEAKLTVTVRRSEVLDGWVLEDDVLTIEGTSSVDVPGLEGELAFEDLVVVSRNEAGDLVFTTESLRSEDRWRFDRLVGKAIAQIRCSVHTHLRNHLRNGLHTDRPNTRTARFEVPSSALDEIIHRLAGLVYQP